MTVAFTRTNKDKFVEELKKEGLISSTANTPASTPNPPLSLFKVERENAEISQSKLAVQLNVSKSAIARTEQGLFVSPNAEYVKWLVDNRGYSKRKLETVYRDFQERTRKYHGHEGVAQYLSTYVMDAIIMGRYPNIHPIEFMCKNKDFSPRSVASFIKAFCVPYSEVQRWGTYPHLVRSVPSSVIEALKDAGYGETVLNSLTEYYARYRKNRGYEQ